MLATAKKIALMFAAALLLTLLSPDSAFAQTALSGGLDRAVG